MTNVFCRFLQPLAHKLKVGTSSVPQPFSPLSHCSRGRPEAQSPHQQNPHHLQAGNEHTRTPLSVHRRAEDWTARVRFPARARYSSFLHIVQIGSGAHPASYPMVTAGSSPGVQRPRSEGDPSPPTSAEVEWWSCSSTSPYIYHCVVIISAQGQLYLTSLGSSKIQDVCTVQNKCPRLGCRFQVAANELRQLGPRYFLYEDGS
jgi:hypothetical protein